MVRRQADALGLLKDSMPGTFDMVLVDSRMPVMDELKMKYLPILALTGEKRRDIHGGYEGIGLLTSC